MCIRVYVCVCVPIYMCMLLCSILYNIVLLYNNIYVHNICLIIGGLVDYRAFCRFADPSDGARTAIQHIQSFITTIQTRDNMSYKDIFITLFNNITSDIHEDFFVERLIVTQVDLTPTELSALYKYIDLDEDNCININQLLAVLNLDELRGMYSVYIICVLCIVCMYNIQYI